MLGDAALTAAGAPLGMVALGMRAAGGAAEQAQQSGATAGEQFMAALGTAAGLKPFRKN